MKTYIILCIIVVCTIDSYGQILNQDASGKSSIVWQGSSINIDITESLIKLNHYGGFNRNGFFGFDLQAKNETGVADLFKEGEFTPNARLSVLIGTRKVQYGVPDSTTEYGKLEAILAAKEQTYQSFKKLVKQSELGCPDSPNLALREEKIVSDLLGFDKWGTENLLETLAGYIKKIVSNRDSSSSAHCVGLVKKQINSLAAELAKDTNYVKLRDLMENADLRREARPSFITNSTKFYYIRGGINAMEFTYDQGSRINSFESRFRDTLHVSPNIELGMTLQKKMNYFGFNFGVMYVSNFDELEKGNYSYQRRDSSMTSGSLTQQKSFSAYSGDYLQLTKAYINVDYLRMIGLGQSHYILIGPFLRQNISFKTPQVNHNTVLGIGVNYINGKSGKLLLGIYVQSNNIWGDQNSNFTKTIRFGLNTRISLSSIFKVS